MSVTTTKLRPSVLRNLSTVSLHKFAQIVGQVVAVFTIPRLLGVDDHGRFQFVLAYAYLAQILGDLGTLEVMSRFVPAMAEREAYRLYNRTLAFKTTIGLLCGLIATSLVLLLSSWMRPDWALLIGLGTLLHIVGWVPFQFLLGWNRVGLWMVEQSWRQWVLVLLLWLLYPWLGLGGTIWAWVLMEATFLGLGLWWAREYWQPGEFSLEWRYMWPYVRFGLGFALANMISAVLYRSAPVLLEIMTGQSAEAGYISLATGLFLMSYLLLTQFSQSITPLLSQLYARQQTAQIQKWIKNFVDYSWLLGWLLAIAVWLTADWGVLFAFGRDYALAAPALKWISLGIPLSGPMWAGIAIATVTGRGRVRFGASLAALLLFLLAAIWLIPGYASAGASMAMSLAVTANLLILSLFLRPEFKLPWFKLLTSGAIAGSIIWAIEVYGLSITNWGIF